jgi:hypothetical protein
MEVLLVTSRLLSMDRRVMGENEEELTRMTSVRLELN